MQRRELQGKMYELTGASLAQKTVLAAIAGVMVLFAWWLLAGGGVVAVGALLGWLQRSGDAGRRLCLAAGFTVYYARILFTEFVFLKRGVGWSEVFTIAPWIFAIILLLGMEGGTNQSPFGAAAWSGVALFIAGSWMNSYAEYRRHVWKQRLENRGRLYNGSFFRYCRHPNYLGDLLSFSGLCLMAGAWVTAVIPVLMLAGFVFVNIPVLDRHLREKYGSAFDEYAGRTRKLIPFVY